MKLKNRLNKIYERHYNSVMFLISILGIVISLLSPLYCGIKKHYEFLIILFSVGICILVYRLILINVRRTYYKEIDGNQQYYRWHIKVMRQLYSEASLTSLFDQLYTTKITPCNSINCIISPDDLVRSGKTNLKRMFKSSKVIRSMFPGVNLWILRLKYRFIVNHTIKYYYLPGYMLDRYANNVIYCKLGSYIQNVYTSHILEYELYKAYKKIKRSSLNSNINVPEDILNYLPYRKLIHQNCNNDIGKILSTGTGRFSLITVQLIIVYYSKKDRKFKTLIKRRSDKHVTSKMNYYQFVPAGGFDMCEKEKDLYNMQKLENGCSPKNVIYREFLEELFDQKNFDGIYDDNGNTDPNNKIYGTEQIRLVERLIENGLARLVVLGTSVELVTLRHSISYALVVYGDDGVFEQDIIYNLRYNDEFSNYNGDIECTIGLDDLEKRFIGNSGLNTMITPDSVALYKLFKGNKVCQGLINKTPVSRNKVVISIYNADMIHVSK